MTCMRCQATVHINALLPSSRLHEPRPIWMMSCAFQTSTCCGILLYMLCTCQAGVTARCLFIYICLFTFARCTFVSYVLFVADPAPRPEADEGRRAGHCHLHSCGRGGPGCEAMPAGLSLRPALHPACLCAVSVSALSCAPHFGL